MGNPRLVVKVDMVVGFRNTWAGDHPFCGFQTPPSPGRSRWNLRTLRPQSGRKGVLLVEAVLHCSQLRGQSLKHRPQERGRVVEFICRRVKPIFSLPDLAAQIFGSRSTVTARILRRPPGQLPLSLLGTLHRSNLVSGSICSDFPVNKIRF